MIAKFFDQCRAFELSGDVVFGRRLAILVSLAEWGFVLAPISFGGMPEMLRWKTATWVLALMPALTACESLHTGLPLSPPDLMDQISNSDLSARGPIAAGSPNPRDIQTGAIPQKYYGEDISVDLTSAPPGLSKGEKGYDLNFSEAELSELAKVILGDTLSIPYLYDPRVQGRVTVSTGGPVSREQLLLILESVLNMNQGALVRDDDRYRIIPKSEAAQSAYVNFDYVSERRNMGAGYGVSVLPLRYASSDTMLRMLNSVGAQPEDVPASVYKTLLIVRGTSQQRQALLEVARGFDVDWMKGQSGGIFPLQNASADEVMKELEDVFQTQGIGKGMVRFRPVKRANSILVLTQKRQLLDKVGSWIERLDRGGGEGANYYVYRVENGRAADLAEVLKATFAASGTTIKGPESNEVAPGSAASQISSSGTGETSSGGLSSAVSGLSTSAGSGGLSDGASTSLASTSEPSTSESSSTSLTTGSLAEGAGSETAPIRIVADELNNKLLIRATAQDYRQVLRVLRKIDQPPLQVLINATLAEVTLNDKLQYGVQFFLEKNSGTSGLLGFTNGSAINIAPAVPGLNFVVGSVANDPKVIIDALANETAVRVVSSPSVVVLHNQSATLQVGDEVPISTRQATSVINPDAPLVNEIQFKNTGVILTVTPRINSNGLVSMQIQQEISAVTSTNTVGQDSTLTPTISKRSITSAIAVQSGQMVVLGGLMSERFSKDKSGIPVLNKIPYLGDVLGNSTDKSRSKTELVVFLRPVVIRDPEDASRVAESVRAAMESLAPRPSAPDAAYAEGAGQVAGAKSFK